MTIVLATMLYGVKNEQFSKLWLDSSCKVYIILNFHCFWRYCFIKRSFVLHVVQTIMKMVSALVVFDIVKKVLWIITICYCSDKVS